MQYIILRKPLWSREVDVVQATLSLFRSRDFHFVSFRANTSRAERRQGSSPALDQVQCGDVAQEFAHSLAPLPPDFIHGGGCCRRNVGVQQGVIVVQTVSEPPE